MRYTINYVAVVQASYDVEASSEQEAGKLFREAGDMRHVFAANTSSRPAVEIRSIHNADRKITHWPDGKVQVDAKD